jgi:hypothetical protein
VNFIRRRDSVFDRAFQPRLVRALRAVVLPGCPSTRRELLLLVVDRLLLFRGRGGFDAFERLLRRLPRVGY